MGTAVLKWLTPKASFCFLSCTLRRKVLEVLDLTFVAPWRRADDCLLFAPYYARLTNKYHVHIIEEPNQYKKKDQFWEDAEKLDWENTCYSAASATRNPTRYVVQPKVKSGQSLLRLLPGPHVMYSVDTLCTSTSCCFCFCSWWWWWWWRWWWWRWWWFITQETRTVKRLNERSRFTAFLFFFVLVSQETCLNEKFVVFANDIDLQHHLMERHGNSLANRRIQVSLFLFYYKYWSLSLSSLSSLSSDQAWEPRWLLL